ncbi:Afadin and alpha-actinin-binding-domain-containing protein [Staphylotrichum tortipilum]|uniref:Afadin and alpha-actinin-binding-domain-containing protein n=1 Tax=Staphylotrichum tortipilum TaxID=2831512 RepID=A0AAN6MLU1_9PEZI|nr:Afadin and alpha-actinin-binding-domain-containing protein [Staphylotrichum longicolle]
MIESENLRTASLYINNQLLSRGLLHDGHALDFAHPGDTDGEVAETMSRIMAVRDAEHRESLSATLRTLRAESLRQANDIQRLQEKYAEAQRKVGLSEAAEAALRTHLKTTEATVHRLKEEASRTKTLVAQTRSSCANEVRKRDRQMESIKRAVTEAGRARGAGKSSGITTITVVGEIGPDAAMGSPSTAGMADQSCDLRTETNAFLAELAKGLSEENEGLLQLVRRTTEQLKEMSGWDVATNGHPIENGDGDALVLAANPADMSLEVDGVLEHLRTILTNPSFVPIEEVVVREDEIHRLRDGWEKMETRWKEAVHLIDGWRRRMQASGRPVNVEELKMGLRLSPVKVNNVEETAHGYALSLQAVLEDREVEGLMQHCEEEESLNLVPMQDVDDADSDVSSEFEHNLEDLDLEEPNVEILEQSVMIASAPLAAPSQLSPLRDPFAIDHRVGRSNKRPQRTFPSITEERTRDIVNEEPPLPPPHATIPQQSPKKKPILSLRTVPPEEAAGHPLPPSAAVSTPDTSVDSVPFSKTVDEPTSKASTASSKPSRRPATTTTTTRKREPAKEKEIAAKEAPARKPAAARKKEAEEPKPTARSSPTKVRPTRPPITRGRQEARPNDRPTHAPKAASRAGSTTSLKSAGGNKSTSSEQLMPPPPPPPQQQQQQHQQPSRTRAPSPPPSPTRSPKRVNSRLPLPRPGCPGVLPAPQQSPLNMATITAKLAASERDADAARVRAKLKAARLVPGKGSANSAVNLPPPVELDAAADITAAAAAAAGRNHPGVMSTRSFESDSAAGSGASTSASDGAPSSTTTATTAGFGGRDEEADELGFDPPPRGKRVEQQQQQQQQQQGAKVAPARKRERRASKTASRRRSTLNRWELDALIQGGTVAVER